MVKRVLINKEGERGLRFVKSGFNDSFARTVTKPARMTARGHGTVRSGLSNY